MLRLTLIAILALVPLGCGGPQDESKDEAADEIVGRPPPPSADPFYFATMPAEAVAAAPTGTIGDASKPSTSVPGPKTDVSGPSARAPKATQPESSRCFSCIKICPVESGEARCPTKDDVICGWGVHPELATASDLAQAECDGALNLVRESPRWSRIDGGCPIATCE